MTEWHIYVIAAAAWLLSYIKIPFKKMTAELISDTAVRKRVNKLIILLPVLFSFIGVWIDLLVFKWDTADNWTALIHPGLSAAGISIIIYSAVEKFFTGTGGDEYDGLVGILSSAGLGNNSAVKKLLDDFFGAVEGDTESAIEKLIPEKASDAQKTLISSALLMYMEKLSANNVTE